MTEAEIKADSSLLAYFSIAMISLSGFIMGFLIYRATEQFTSLDKMPEILPLIPDTLEKLGGNPGIAHVGLYIKDFTEFDLLNNQFMFSGILWFLFDPSIISLETLNKFSFEKGEIASLSPPSTRIVQGKLLARYDIRVKMKSNLTFSLFPFDSHIIYIVLDNNYVSPGEIIMETAANDFVVSTEISITGWKMTNTSVYSGYSVAALEKQDGGNVVSHPRVIFALEYKRAGMRQPLSIILPLILIFFMAIFSFTMDPKNYTPILALSTGTITALLAYRFVIENLSPKVGYFMLSDYIFFLFLMASFIVFFINIGLIDLRQKHMKKLIIIIHALLIAIFAYLMRF